MASLAAAEHRAGAESSTVNAADRVVSLDILRGLAVMGIFAMNIVNFAMPNEAYLNPAAYGSEGPADMFAWFAAFVLVDGKMRGLFSVLFGASMLLVVMRAEDGGRPPAPVHYLRMAWLLVFGLLHAVLVWDGDILVHYALVGMIAYPFRNADPRKLATWAGLLLLVQLLLMAGMSAAFIATEAAAIAPGASADAIARWNEMGNSFAVPGTTELTQDFALHRGPYAGLVAERWSDLPQNPIFVLILYGMETLAYMLAGMWGLRTGFLTAAWPRRRYVRIAGVCLLMSLPAYAALALWLQQSGFRTSYVFALALGATTLVRPVMIAGLAALIILATSGGGALVSRIAAAGRAAFTNYLGASLVATTIFYGYGLDMFGRLSRWELYPMVFAVWMGMLLWSKPWLDRFRYGPFEWLWRSLSRGEAQAMRR